MSIYKMKNNEAQFQQTINDRREYQGILQIRKSNL